MKLNEAMEQIKESMPGILSDTNMGTKKYHHVQTWDLVEAFSKLGYEISRWDMQVSKKNGKHAPHMVEMVLKSKKFQIGKDMVCPQVIILNSYNAKQALRIKFGIFYAHSSKMALTICNALEGTRIVHMGEKVDKLVEDIHNDISVRMTDLDYKTYLKKLNNQEKLDLVNGLLETRFGKKSKNVDATMFLKPIYDDNDVPATAWEVYQLCTERILKGLYVIYRTKDDGYKHETAMSGKQCKKFTVSEMHQKKLMEKLNQMLGKV